MITDAEDLHVKPPFFHPARFFQRTEKIPLFFIFRRTCPATGFSTEYVILSEAKDLSIGQEAWDTDSSASPQNDKP